MLSMLFDKNYIWVIFALRFLKVSLFNSMYAIVDIGGKQFKVTQDQSIFVPKMEGEAGASVSFDQVLLVDNHGKVDVGTPQVAGAKVTGKILEHVKGDKVLVFKKKRRKGYKKLNGHRQDFTKVQIEKITS
jgi:large subunit ribosomal protein L21